jgi:hypothetical protein
LLAISKKKKSLLAALAMVAAADYSTGNEHSWYASDIVRMCLVVGGSALAGKNITITNWSFFLKPTGEAT